MKKVAARRKTCLDLTLLLSLFAVLDVLLTRIFLTLGASENNHWLFFSQLLEKNYALGMLYIVSCKALFLLVLLKGVLMVDVVRLWLIIILVFTVSCYFFVNIYSADLLFYIKYGDSLFNRLLYAN